MAYCDRDDVLKKPSQIMRMTRKLAGLARIALLGSLASPMLRAPTTAPL
jgi:hypothetical protein